jgi:hypothetical protein
VWTTHPPDLAARIQALGWVVLNPPEFFEVTAQA